MADFEFDAETWLVLNRLLDEALDLAPTERPRWLDRLPEEHRALRPKLESLLRHANGSGPTSEVLGTLPKFDLDPLAETTAEDSETPGEIGENVGPYRLKRLLGKGGMGAVWLARRVDGMLERDVALKLPRALSSRPELASRMAREREILASLDHPNIAKLYDAGLTKDGQPFLALELIEGRPVDVYAREQGLDVTARLKLFVQIAKAVAHAHSHLVVHRDIKPSNILVTKNEHVRLLDFGIAKLLEDGEAKETELTKAAGRALTLAYAAPEQILGEPISVATDVYSLGVVLYELVTGQRPYDPERETVGAIEDAILNIDPKKPSDVVESTSVRRAIRGDLDTILLKALKKQRSERYATVNAFVDDVERFLAGRPVLARPDSAAYRFRKFVARNRLMVAAAALVLIAIVAGAGIALWQAQIAIAEKERAEEVKEFIVSVFEDADPYGGGEDAVTAIDLLRNAEGRIREGFDEGSEIRIELLSIVGLSLISLEDYGSAASVLEHAVNEAEASLGPTHRRTLHARVARTSAYRYQGRTDEMKAELEEIVPELERAEDADPADLLDAIENQAHVAIDEGRYADAELAAERAFGVALDTRGPSHKNTVEMSRLLTVAYRFNQNPKAHEAAERAYRLNVEMYREDHPSVIDARAAYALSLMDRGELPIAIEQMSKAIEDARARFGESSGMVGFFSGRLAQMRVAVGDIDGALLDANTHLNVLTETAQPGSYTYATTIAGHATIVLASRRAENALRGLSDALIQLDDILEPTHKYVVQTRLSRALALGYLGEREDADNELSAIAVTFRSDPQLSWARWLTVSGIVARLDGDYETALSKQREALDAIEPGPRSERLRVRALVESGLNQLELSKHVEARRSLEEANEILDTLNTHLGPLQLDALVGLGQLELYAGRHGRARELFARASARWHELDSESQWARDAQRWLARSRPDS